MADVGSILLVFELDDEFEFINDIVWAVSCLEIKPV